MDDVKYYFLNRSINYWNYVPENILDKIPRDTKKLFIVLWRKKLFSLEEVRFV